MILHSEWHREPLAEPEPTPAPLCDDCNRPVTDDDAGPSCGSHALHSWCSSPCRDCVDELRQVDEDARAEREWREL